MSDCTHFSEVKCSKERRLRPVLEDWLVSGIFVVRDTEFVSFLSKDCIVPGAQADGKLSDEPSCVYAGVRFVCIYSRHSNLVTLD